MLCYFKSLELCFVPVLQGTARITWLRSGDTDTKPDWMTGDSNHIPNSDRAYSLLELGIDFVFLISLHTDEFCFQPSSAGRIEMPYLAQSNSKLSEVCRDIPVDNWNLGWTHTVLNKIHIILINQTLKSKTVVTPFQIAQLFAEVAFQHLGKAGSFQQICPAISCKWITKPRNCLQWASSNQGEGS